MSSLSPQTCANAATSAAVRDADVAQPAVYARTPVSGVTRTALSAKAIGGVAHSTHADSGTLSFSGPPMALTATPGMGIWPPVSHAWKSSKPGAKLVDLHCELGADFFERGSSLPWVVTQRDVRRGKESRRGEQFR